MKISLLTILILLTCITPQVYAQHDLSDDPKEHYNLGQDYYKKGRYDEAILEFKKAIEHDAKDTASLFGLGNSYFLKQDFKESIKYYQEVTKLKPDFPKAHYALALAYRRVGNTEGAEREFDLYNRLSAQKPTEAPKPTVKKVEPKKEEAPPERPAVKRLEPPKEVVKKPEEPAERPTVSRLPEAEVPRSEVREITEPEKVLKKARPSETREVSAPERPVPKKEAKPAVKVVKKPQKEKNIVSRFIGTLKDWGPMGKFLLWAIYYTLAVQVWIGIVVLFGIFVLWRRH
jgi:tetratricopeptide (TPR) repeat protein